MTNKVKIYQTYAEAFDALPMKFESTLSAWPPILKMFGGTLAALGCMVILCERGYITYDESPTFTLGITSFVISIATLFHAEREQEKAAKIIHLLFQDDGIISDYTLKQTVGEDDIYKYEITHKDELTMGQYDYIS